MTDRPEPLSQETARALASDALRFKGPAPATSSNDWRPVKLSSEESKVADVQGQALLAAARARFK